MFHFSVRDLFWLTLVVAIALAWFVREQRLQAELGQVHSEVELANDRTRRWRAGAGVLEHVIKQEGREVFWNLKASILSIEEPSAEISAYSLSSHAWEPSGKEEE